MSILLNKIKYIIYEQIILSHDEIVKRFNEIIEKMSLSKKYVYNINNDEFIKKIKNFGGNENTKLSEFSKLLNDKFMRIEKSDIKFYFKKNTVNAFYKYMDLY